MQENKMRWKERAAKEEEERKLANGNVETKYSTAGFLVVNSNGIFELPRTCRCAYEKRGQFFELHSH
uniref:Uncharacterized protein n=1 Tax=Ascaris lumbricoides TaxID=6252 RepID=A0A0M3HFB0_ASCLU